MKKMTAILACTAASAMLLCACGSSDAGTEGNTSGSGSTVSTEADSSAEGAESSGAGDSASIAAPTGYYFTLNGVTVSVNAAMAPIAEALGEPTSYFESESCAFQGLDKTYTYGSVVISTYPVDGEDFVYTIELKDDTVETTEGICIGSTKDDVTAAYGTASSETDTALSYEKDDSVLAFIFDGDSVANITYTAITE
jgi:hypothetical protein